MREIGAGTPATFRHRLAIMRQVAVSGGRIRDQRSMIAVAPRRLSAHVALPSAVFVGHVRHLDLAGADNTPVAVAATAATLDLLIYRVVLVDEATRQMHMLAVVTVQLMMPGTAVAATIHDLGVSVIVWHRGTSTTAGRPGTGVHLAAVIRSTSPTGMAECQGVVCPRGILLFGAAVSGIAGVGLKRNVLRRES